MKAIIVDDEPKAIQLLSDYLNHFNAIELVGTFRNGFKAFEFLSINQVDLIFLDINMPHINGMSLSKMIDKRTKIVFTTAYSEYAVESYEVGAVDYLLKPISLERFTKTVSKIIIENKTSTTDNEDKEIIFVKSGTKVHRIDPGDIFYIEKDGNYSIYYFKDSRIIARESVAEILHNLPSYFYQVHKSYIVNKNCVSSIEKDVLTVNGKEIAMGASFKKQVLEALLNK